MHQYVPVDKMDFRVTGWMPGRWMYMQTVQEDKINSDGTG